MATKAELQAELAALRRELAQRDEPVKTPGSEVVAAQPADQEPEVDAIQHLLDDLGVTAEAGEAFKDNLLKELNELQNDKPLIVLVAALALGVIIGRAFK